MIAELAHRAQPQGEGSNNGGLLFAAGLVTGEALMGILLALPIALGSLWPSLGSDPFRIFATPPLGAWPGLLAVAGVAWMLYRTGVAKR